MLKKRILFTLLYSSGQFMLSRNFRLQAVGDLDWLRVNYDFSHVSRYVDELVVLDVTRDGRDLRSFAAMLQELTADIFTPVAAGGGITSVEDARLLLGHGADKVVVNTVAFENRGVIEQIAAEFGDQCLIASVDLTERDGTFYAIPANGDLAMPSDARWHLDRVADLPIGEIYLNSMDRDGTGNGFDFRILELLPKSLSKPVILAGGVGNSGHLVEGLKDERVDAVTTAHLFNFIGDGLEQARIETARQGVQIPLWDYSSLGEFRRT